MPEERDSWCIFLLYCILQCRLTSVRNPQAGLQFFFKYIYPVTVYIDIDTTFLSKYISLIQTSFSRSHFSSVTYYDFLVQKLGYVFLMPCSRLSIQCHISPRLAREPTALLFSPWLTGEEMDSCPFSKGICAKGNTKRNKSM